MSQKATYQQQAVCRWHNLGVKVLEPLPLGCGQVKEPADHRDGRDLRVGLGDVKRLGRGAGLQIPDLGGLHHDVRREKVPGVLTAERGFPVLEQSLQRVHDAEKRGKPQAGHKHWTWQAINQHAMHLGTAQSTPHAARRTPHAARSLRGATAPKCWRNCGKSSLKKSPKYLK